MTLRRLFRIPTCGDFLMIFLVVVVVLSSVSSVVCEGGERGEDRGEREVEFDTVLGVGRLL